LKGGQQAVETDAEGFQKDQCRVEGGSRMRARATPAASFRRTNVGLKDVHPVEQAVDQLLVSEGPM